MTLEKQRKIPDTRVIDKHDNSAKFWDKTKSDQIIPVIPEVPPQRTPFGHIVMQSDPDLINTVADRRS